MYYWLLILDFFSSLFSLFVWFLSFAHFIRFLVCARCWAHSKLFQILIFCYLVQGVHWNTKLLYNIFYVFPFIFRWMFVSQYNFNKNRMLHTYTSNAAWFIEHTDSNKYKCLFGFFSLVVSIGNRHKLEFDTLFLSSNASNMYV